METAGGDRRIPVRAHGNGRRGGHPAGGGSTVPVRRRISMPKIARIAYIVAFVVAGLTVISGLFGQIVLLPVALIPLMAGIGIRRRRVWSAYGFALYLSGQLFIVPFVLFRHGASTTGLAGIIGAAVWLAALIPLLFFAGRSLAAAGSERGRAWPDRKSTRLNSSHRCISYAV